MPPNCLETWAIDRGTSPWRDFTRSYEEEQAGREVRAVDLGGAQRIAIDQARRRVVVSAAAFGDLARIDATSLQRGEVRAIGIVRDADFLADPRSLVRFIVTEQLVQTYVHVEASVSLLAEHDDGTRYRAALEAVHTYYTNARHDVPYAFVLGLDRQDRGTLGHTGVLFIRGAAPGDELADDPL